MWSLIVPTKLAVLIQIFGFTRNYHSTSDPCWISNQSANSILVTDQGFAVLWDTLYQIEVEEWQTTMLQEEILELSYQPTARAEYCVSSVAVSDLEYSTQAATLWGKPAAIDMETYHQVVEHFNDDAKETKKTSTGESTLNPALYIISARPTPHEQAKPVTAVIWLSPILSSVQVSLSRI